MAASENDYLMKTAMSTATTMSAPGYTIGNTTINVGSTANYPSDTGFMIGVDEVDGNGERVAGTYNIFRCKVASATQFSGVTYVGGDANRNYSAGTSTRVYLLVSHAQYNRLIDGLLVSHDQDGTLKAGAVDVAAVIADGVITEAKHANGYLHGSDGWIDSTQTWTYASSTTFTVSGDVTAQFVTGTKIKLTQTTAKYFYVTGATYGAPNTTVTVTGGSDYSLANASITSPMYSYMSNPQGFPHWFSYTVTHTGFSSNPTYSARFSVTGRNCTVNYRLSANGTSNGTGYTITAPIQSASSGSAEGACASGADNSVSTTANWSLPSSSSTITFQRTLGATGATTWTNTGSKGTNAVMVYEI
jgi:hypothetical protein